MLSIELIHFFQWSVCHCSQVVCTIADYMAVFSILGGEVISGSLPRKQTRLVQAWIELYQESLMIDWKLAVTGQEPHRIEPLR